MSSWSYEIDTSTAKVMSESPKKKGIYKVKIGVTEHYVTDAGNDRIRWNATVEEGEFKGYTISEGINIPKDSSDFANTVWVTFLASLGHDPAKLKKGKLKLSPKMIEGRTGYCDYTPSIGRGSYPDKKWVLKNMYDMAQARQKLIAAQAPSAEEEAPEAPVNGTDVDSLDFLNV